MIKTVFPFAGPNVQIARLVDVHSRGIDRDWLTKRAAVLTKELSAVRPEKGHSFIHAISMGCMESYGANRNGDGFNEKSAKYEAPQPEKGRSKLLTLDGGLQQYHRTFTKYAKVYKDHANKDPELASGDIVAEAYNPDMRRGELIIKVQNDKWAPELEKAANGEDIAFSMSCRVPYDICSICLHQAANRKEYCDHLKDEMTHVKEGGHQVFAINDRPTFFDFSGVFKPADRIAYGLKKVASEGVMPTEFIPSTQLAELWGISAPKNVLLDTSPRPVQEKLAAMERLAAMEKQIEATGRAVSPEIDGAAECPTMPNDTLDAMRGCDLNELLGTLSQAKISLPIKDFFRLILGNKYDSVAGDVSAAEDMLPGIFNRMLSSGDGVEDVTGMKTYDPAAGLLPKRMRDMIGGLIPDMSFGDAPVGRRVQISIIRGGGPPRKAIKVSHVKSASSNKAASYLAKQYVAYQLAFSRSLEGDVDGGLADRLMIRRNYADS
jgi:hypothetical protein